VAVAPLSFVVVTRIDTVPTSCREEPVEADVDALSVSAATGVIAVVVIAVGAAGDIVVTGTARVMTNFNPGTSL
jgi:hypothetical protein